VGGRAVLGNDGSCASFFFLLGRIFCIDKAALMSLASKQVVSSPLGSEVALL
jgi:hypothetical protein